ncbi:MAG: undecaprenyl-diphosphate phosphatase [Candidatus Bathyarchaeota archaeon]|nr:MAG: undecaprenyl-diphosphate phosphatase [Candidatus Bathyarchaeota archaeon]
MVSIIETVIFGLVQGLTEWLPVSSSGHLAFLQSFFDWEPPTIFYVLLHLGTLSVIVMYFRKDIWRVFGALTRRDFNSEEGKLGFFVVFGNIPTAAIGYIFQDLFESFFSNLFVVSIAFFVTGFLLFITKRRVGDNRALNYLDSLLLGVAQGIAIIPGVSRSGATISTGLLRGINRKVTVKFSFLLSIPAILGALIATSNELNLLVSGEDVLAMLVGVVVSMIVGYLSLKALMRAVMNQKFHWFAFYCWIMGTLIIFSQTL